MQRSRFRRSVAAGLVAAVALAAPHAVADDYSDPDYLAFDADNMARTSERQGYHVSSASYAEGARETFVDTYVSGHLRQTRDADEGRVYAGGGQHLPGGNVGDPEAYYEGTRVEVEFINREGTKLIGNVWPCVAFTESGAACPLVVVTTGSIQVTQHMYGWLTRHLQQAGYTVFTYDVRGQGESETTNQGDLFDSNPQNGPNFQKGTVDALRFALSSEDAPYSDDTVSSVQDHFNPLRGAVDGDHIGLIGHSAGAGAVTLVQQCTSTPVDGVLTPDEDLPPVCLGQRWPIRTVIGYDSLGSSSNPKVPAFSHQGDGYFINAVPAPQAPSTAQQRSLGNNFRSWHDAGLDVMVIKGRGFTHAEWSQIPYIVSATRYGVPQARYYTQAWFDRYLHPDLAVNRAGHRALLDGPIPREPSGEHLDHRASLFSGKSVSAMSISDLKGEGPPLPGVLSLDLRAYADANAPEGVSVAAVGDWAALNAEAEYGTASRGAANEGARPAS